MSMLLPTKISSITTIDPIPVVVQSLQVGSGSLWVEHSPAMIISVNSPNSADPVPSVF